MASGRMLQRKISENEQLPLVIQKLDAEMGPGHGAYAALLFSWMIAHQDVEGRLKGDPRRVRADVFTMLEWVTSADVERYIKALGDAGLLVWYEAEGKKWIWLPGFDGCQPGLRRDKEAPSKIPEPHTGRPIAGVLPDHGRSTAGPVTELPEVAPPLKSESGSLKSEDPDLTHARAVSEAWSNAGLPGLPNTGLPDLADDLGRLKLAPLEACKAFARLRAVWAKNRGMNLGATVANMREHIGWVQQIAKGEIDPEATWPPQATGNHKRAGPDSRTAPLEPMPPATVSKTERL